MISVGGTGRRKMARVGSSESRDKRVKSKKKGDTCEEGGDRWTCQ